MFRVLARRLIAPEVWRATLSAPRIAARRRAGHFVIVRPTAASERIPLTIVAADPERGTIDIIFQVVGATTRELASVPEGGAVADVVGPLGRPTHIERYGRAAVVGGGVGIAPLLPIARALREAGNTLVAILGARTAEHLILEDELAPLSDRLLVATDDGSRGRQGLVTDVLREALAETSFDFVLAVGPVVMMAAVADLTRPLGIRTMASLNPLMIDGTGMCGVCRCNVGGETKLACVEGPEFDAHQVDFANLRRRLGMFREEEAARRTAAEREAHGA